ncbi:hypothetical protein AAFN88_21310 [Pelagibius sp. CAU 1746]|uniref:hypothetical protein n=1 Tax=Pelagibius sp. CAU 1746 TaxID=3140370 RepID=UPI00325B5D1C
MPEFIARLTVRRESEPVDSLSGLHRFVSTRAAFIAQKTLYGYLKTRMGTRYPSMFEDDFFVSSINVAKMHVYAACLSDLAVFAVRRAFCDAAVDDGLRRRAALGCYERGLADNAEQAAGAEAFSPSEALQAFERRLAFFDWHGGAGGSDLFTESPSALVRWAPIAPELKQFDREIVENSVRFAWREVRRQFEKRIDGAAVAAEAQAAGAETRAAGAEE